MNFNNFNFQVYASTDLHDMYEFEQLQFRACCNFARYV